MDVGAPLAVDVGADVSLVVGAGGGVGEGGWSENPGVEADRPVSRQHEVALHEYYGIPFYWTVDGSAPGGGGDPHLQSMRAVRGYTVIARDAAAGRVVDFLVDCDGWTVSDVVVARHHWLAGPRLVLPVGAVEHVSWLGKVVYLDAEALGRTA